jgi:predicted RecA/RadA family phage recombinase
MATATFLQNGDNIDYTPTSAVSAGDVVVQNDLVGVATRDIAANALGALSVSGVFSFPKATGSGSAISAGEKCYWNTSTSKAQTTASTYKLIGKCIAAASDDDTTVEIRLDQ